MASNPGWVSKPHTKSHGGCRSCKTRKVKCDELRPSCTSCTRRRVDCEYPEPVQFKRSTKPKPLSQSGSSTSEGPPTPPYPSIQDFEHYVSKETIARRVLEIRLMHHFVTKIAKKDFLSSHDEKVVFLWQEVAPKQAFEHPHLLNCILATAALHIAKLEPARKEMADIHRVYFNAAISQHRNAIRKLSPANAEAVCIASLMIPLQAFTLLQNPEDRTYSAPYHLFSLTSSCVPVFLEALPMLPESTPLWATVIAKPNLIEFKVEIKDPKYRRPFLHLLELKASEEEEDQETKASYEAVLNFIGRVLVAIETADDPFHIRRMFYSLPHIATEICPEFVSSLRVNNPKALVILAHYFCLAKAVDGVWWMRGIAEREVLGIQSVLPEQWQWTLAWPLQKLAAFAAMSTPPMLSVEA